MTSYVYRAVWPITAPDRPQMALIAEASAALDVMAAGDGCRITGQPTWQVAGDRLLCEAPAVPLSDIEQSAATSRSRLEGDVLRLHGLRWSVRQIAATTGIPHSTVQSIVARYAGPEQEVTAA